MIPWNDIKGYLQIHYSRCLYFLLCLKAVSILIAEFFCFYSRPNAQWSILNKLTVAENVGHGKTIPLQFIKLWDAETRYANNTFKLIVFLRYKPRSVNSHPSKTLAIKFRSFNASIRLTFACNLCIFTRIPQASTNWPDCSARKNTHEQSQIPAPAVCAACSSSSSSSLRPSKYIFNCIVQVDWLQGGHGRSIHVPYSVCFVTLRNSDHKKPNKIVTNTLVIGLLHWTLTGTARLHFVFYLEYILLWIFRVGKVPAYGYTDIAVLCFNSTRW